MLRYVSFPLAFMASTLAAELPIRSIVLYKNGVGYFERAGELRPGESARLEFRAPEMNDVLKSLTVAGRSGEAISGIRYDSSQPLEERLKHYPFQLGGQTSLSGILDQFKGARIELKYGAETVAGVIVSARLVPGAENRAERQELVLLLDSGDLRAFDLAAADALRLTDARLQAQLKDYLAAVNSARSEEKRALHIESDASTARSIVASYMLPTPVWKSSYRLIFGQNADPTLEGWAIVDNTSGEDWNGVRIAVVSGRPVSFISNLYEARFLLRPTVDLPESGVAGPVLHEGAFNRLEQFAAVKPAPPPAALARKSSPSFAASAGVMESEVRQDALSTLAVNTEGRDLGELFEYRFARPVTVKKDESIMLPFVQQALHARKLLIYAESYGRNPLSAAELTNSTGKTLDGGPITIFDGSSYAGEALMETLKAGDKRLISYAVDLGARVTTAFESGRSLVREIHINRGLLTTRAAVEETKTYTLRNVDSRPKTLILEHPARPEYKLLNRKPSETTAGAYRFEVKLAPASTETFPVSEERVYDSVTAVSSLTPDALLSYVQNKALSDAARKQLQQILDVKSRIAAVDAQIQALEAGANEIVHDQDRLRQNLTSLNHVSGQEDQVQKYSRRLADQETELAGLRDRLSDAKKRKAALESELRDLIAKLEF